MANGGDVRVKISGDFEPLNKSVKDSSREIQSIGKSFENTTNRVKELEKQVEELSDKSKQASESAREMAKSTSGISLDEVKRQATTLTAELEKQKELLKKSETGIIDVKAIKNTKAQISSLEKEYDAILSGSKTPQSLLFLQKGLKDAENNLKNFYERFREIDNEKFYNIGDPAKLKELQAERQEISNKISETKLDVKELKKEFDKISFDMSLSEEAQAINSEIQSLKKNLEYLEFPKLKTDEIKNNISDIERQLSSGLIGSVNEAARLETELQNAEKSLENAKTGAESLGNQLQQAREAPLFNFLAQAEQAEQYIRDFESEIERLNGLLAQETEPAKIVALKHEIVATKEQFQNFLDNLSRPVADVMNATMLEGQLETAREKASELQSEFDGLSTKGKIGDSLAAVFGRGITAELTSAREQVELLENELEKLDNKNINIDIDTGAVSSLTQFAPAAETASVAVNGIKSAFDKIVTAAAQAASVAKSAFDKIGATVGKISKGVVKAASGFLNMLKNIRLLGKESGKASNGVSKLWNRIITLGAAAFIFNVIRKGLRQLSEDMRNLLMANTEFAEAWNQIKVNMLTAFAPLWEVIEPAIVGFMQLLARFTAVLAQFMAVLFGKTYEQARNSAKALNQQARAIRDVGNAGKKASQQLAGIDELTILSDTSGAEEAAGLNFDFEVPDLTWIDEFANKFKNIFKIIDLKYWKNLGSTISEFIANGLDKIPWDKIRAGADAAGQNIGAFINGLIGSERVMKSIGTTAAQAINTIVDFANALLRTVDFKSLGNAVSAGINKFLSTFRAFKYGETIGLFVQGIFDLLDETFDKLDWNLLGEKITDILTGIFSKIRLEKIGATLAKGTKGLFTALYKVFSGFDIKKIGSDFAKGLNELFDKDLWSQLGKTISAVINFIVDFFDGLFEDFDFESAGKAISMGITNLFSEIDWENAFVTIVKGLIGLLTTISTFLIETDWGSLAQQILDGLLGALGNLHGFELAKSLVDVLFSIVSSAISVLITLIKNAPEIISVGFEIIAGILFGIINGMANIFSWLYENVVLPIINAFKSLFGIASPSTVMEELGRFLIEGLLAGITALIETVIGVFAGIWQGIQDVFSTVGDFFAGVFSGAVSLISGAWSGVTGFFGGVWSGIQDVFSGVGDFFGNVFEEAKNLVQGAWDGVTGFFGGIWSGIQGVFSGVGSFFGGAFESAKNLAQGAWGGVTGFFGGAWNGIKGVFGNVGSFFGNAFSGAWNGVKNAFSGVTGFFGGVVDKINGTLGGGISKIKEIGGNLAKGLGDGIKGAAEKAVESAKNLGNKITSGLKSLFGIKSPSTLWRDEIGAMLGEGVAVGFADMDKDIIKAVAGTIGEAENEAEEYAAFETLGVRIGQALLDGLQTAYDPIVGFFNDIFSNIDSLFNGFNPKFSAPQFSAAGMVSSQTMQALADKGTAYQSQIDYTEQLSGIQQRLDRTQEQLEITNSFMRELLETERENKGGRFDVRSFAREIRNIQNAEQWRAGR
jgi:phage-related protein